MNPETVFSGSGMLAMVGWILLIVAPRWRWSSQIIAKFVIPALLGVVYATVIATHWSGHRGGFSSLEAVAELFSDRWILLAGWVHYLAFDLFIGAWEVRDSRDAKLPHWLVISCLLLTFLLGPAGLLAYFALRGGSSLVKARSIKNPETV